ncbi:evolutionarily conserved signaling intermediate in Toll pathway, mitochondrial-like [Octopus sinensis]|uniref:Evolutionarily conserved signaling intermediate in Toll pathway, mitochondrial n=1 Tax=Octopus sinensis TaxID=2607531 RepID=A0A6P7U5T1_9MOLL|nr:evolutionarily conserved signaling intermediate in Toll pathway, mitochondrial-like [Octopus sinensis]XP_029657690.1 evolutionarily conserved signaling intermediate in Toll pathway, mitochondrial-like [Octopus sinensis]XP_029657692.1 evolutionarily conserved signaling intermediate in Toll pathway, mitochondrial-like [Octopus sinensis]
MYWMPKFKGMNPHYVPPLPKEHVKSDHFQLTLARVALKRMSFDIEAVISCHKLRSQPNSLFIVSSQSPLQKELIEKAPACSQFCISGPFKSFLRKHMLSYYVLGYRTDATGRVENSDENLFNFYFESEEDRKKLKPVKTIHEQDDETILALCILVGNELDFGSTLSGWLTYLQEENPSLVSRQVNIRLSE